MTTFSFDRELRFGDCDPSGIAYFPSYLNILNGVVEEFWAEIGFPWPELITVRKIGTPTVHLTCDFSRPSMFGDRLTFGLRIARGRRIVAPSGTCRLGREWHALARPPGRCRDLAAGSPCDPVAR
ncbi:acyl-CoA thioesterase FadM [Bradyrhizobium japonicum]